MQFRINIKIQSKRNRYKEDAVFIYKSITFYRILIWFVFNRYTNFCLTMFFVINMQKIALRLLCTYKCTISANIDGGQSCSGEHTYRRLAYRRIKIESSLFFQANFCWKLPFKLSFGLRKFIHEMKFICKYKKNKEMNKWMNKQKQSYE